MLVQKIEREFNFPLTQELARVQLRDELILAKYYSNDKNAHSVVHSHPFFELILPISGCSMVYSIDGAMYQLGLGSIIFIPAEIYHTVQMQDEADMSDRLVVQIDLAVWNRAISHTGLENPIWNRQVTVVNRDIASTWDFRGLFERMINTQHLQKDIQDRVLECQLVELQLLLQQNITNHTTAAPSSTSQVVAKTVAYLQSNYTDPELTVTRLAQAAFVSREYLSRIFKEYTMESIHSYLTNLRIQHSRKAIAEGKSVLDACVESGFNNYSSFYKTFRALYGITPNDYKKQLFQSLKTSDLSPNQTEA